jgi:Fe-S-cluster-containing hydrogenase component 2
MYIDETHCTRCGACLPVCPSGAIHWVDDQVRIDSALCNGCRSCLDVCPSDAIISALPVTHAQILPAPTHGANTGTLSPHTLVPVLGAAVTFLGREVAPRVAAAVVETVLNRTAERSCTHAPTSVRKDRQRRLRQRVRRIER